MAHCQMPCGIYHDDIVFNRIDQYIETIYKGISVMNNSKFSDVREKNEFMRWVIQKEESSNETASLLTKYFLQQKIAEGKDEGTIKKLQSVHKLLLLLVAIKQNSELKFLNDFSKEWDSFKLMFHLEDYECEMENLRRKKDEAKQKKEHPDPEKKI